MKVVNYEVSSSVFSKLQDYVFGSDFSFQGKPYRISKQTYDSVEAILLEKKGGMADKKEFETVFVFKTNQQKKEAKLKTPHRANDFGLTIFGDYPDNEPTRANLIKLIEMCSQAMAWINYYMP